MTLKYCLFGPIRRFFTPKMVRLLGINGSGKTSFINALRLLYEGIVGLGVENLVQTQWGGYSQIVNCTGSDSSDYIQVTYVFDSEEVNKYNHAANFHFDIYYQITLRPLGSTDYFLDEKIWTGHNGNQGQQYIYLDFHNGKGHLSTRTENKNSEDSKILFQEYADGDISGHELVLKQISDPHHYLPLHTLRRAIENFAVYNFFDTGENSKLRKPSAYSTGSRLWKNGENLVQILSYLSNNHSLDFEKAEKALHKVNPMYKSINMDNIAGQAYLSLRERNLNKSIGVLHLSDGTLCFLLLESIFLNPERGAIVAIDEPERGLHPDMIVSVAEMIKNAAVESQLIMATHSPLLLNQFELDDILVFDKDEENITKVRKISEDDFPEDKDCSLPGLLWLNGELGGKRW